MRESIKVKQKVSTLNDTFRVENTIRHSFFHVYISKTPPPDRGNINYIRGRLQIILLFRKYLASLKKTIKWRWFCSGNDSRSSIRFREPKGFLSNPVVSRSVPQERDVEFIIDGWQAKPCSCRAQKTLHRRMKNALIPAEFEHARYGRRRRNNVCTSRQRSIYKVFTTSGKIV